MKRSMLAVAAAGLALGVFALPGHASAPVEPSYLRRADARIVAAIYTPFVWSALSTAGGGPARSAETSGGVSRDPVVVVAFREPGTPPRLPLSDQPWKLALVDAAEALSWDRATAQHPLWLADAPALARQSGITEVAAFTVAAGFRPSQLADRRFVILYRTVAMEGRRQQTEFTAQPLPDLATLRWRE